MADEQVSGNGAALASDPEVQGMLRSIEGTLGEIKALETQVLLDRMRWANDHGVTFGDKRREYDIFGYDHVVTYRQYRAEYDRGGIAGSVVDVMPDACWRGEVPFEVVEDEDPENDTEFEKVWKTLSLKHKIPTKLRRADILARLSTYSVILIGAPGNLDQELPKVSNPDALLFLKPYSGGGGPGDNSERRNLGVGARATIYEYNENSQSPRFGEPESYQINFFQRRLVAGETPLPRVHWSRIIHIPADNPLEDEVFGQPALERVWNLLADLRKVTGGGSEAFWLRANQGLHLDIDKDMDLDKTKNTLDELKKQAEAYKHQLDRWIRTRGVKVETLGSDVANFAAPADAIITQIAGSKRVPKRILTGSEMGELASTQDRENFRDQINGRQAQHCGPNMVRQLVDRLITYGYMPAPRKGPLEYQVTWPQIEVLTETEKADGAYKWAQTKIGEDPVFVQPEIRDKWYGMPPLTEEQLAEVDKRKEEAIKRQQESMAAAQPPQGKEEEQKAQLRAAEDDELTGILAAAIAAGDEEIVAQILGLRALGGPGSGNFGHAGRPGEIGGSAPAGEGGSEPSGAKSEARKEFGRLKAQWAAKNNELFNYIDTPDSPEAKAHLNEMKDLVKQMHALDADPGGVEGIGLPGGPRDVVVVGGGPGGLSASINASAEGYDTLLVEGSEQVGGQARQSTRIENLPGFPLGVSGERLSKSMEEQSLRVGSEHKLGTKVTGITYDPDTDLKTVTLSNGETIEARTVILAGGLSFANHAPWDVSESQDVVYAQPKTLLNAAPGRDIVVAGGSNGAAQAAIACAENDAKSVTLISRGPLEKSMSDYQINQVRNHPAIKPIVADIRQHEKGHLVLSDGRRIPADKIGVFYGAAPDTKWLPPSIEQDKGKVVTSHSHSYETSMPGVFAVGDITHNGAGRIGVAIGEGQSAVKNMYSYFETLRARPKRRAAESLRALASKPIPKRASDVRRWNTIVEQAFGLDFQLPWYGQTVEGQKLPRRPPRLSAANEKKIRHAEFNPDQPRDDSGKWTSGGGGRLPFSQSVSSVRGPANPNPRAELPKQTGALEDREYQSIETPISIKATDEDSLGGGNMNEVLKLTTAQGDEVVFKPTDGERFYIPGRSPDDLDPEDEYADEPELVRNDVSNTDATLAEREVLAYRVDNELGLDIVPRTAYAEYQGREGAAQTFIKDAYEGVTGSVTAEDQAKMGVLDAVIGNQDRHPMNALTSQDGKLVAIDHGYAFGHTPPGGYIRSWALAGIGPDTLSRETQAALASKLEKFDFLRVLKGSHLDSEEESTFRERVKRVADRLRRGEAHKIRDDFDTSAW